MNVKLLDIDWKQAFDRLDVQSIKCIIEGITITLKVLLKV